MGESKKSITKKTADSTENPFGILTTWHEEEFLKSIKVLPLDALIDLLEPEIEPEAEKLISLMHELDLHVLRNRCNQVQAERIAKLALQILESDEKSLSFEAACLLKDLQLPQSYQGIINILKKGELEDSTKRMLSSAAENIAVSTSISLMETTNGHRSERWKERVFFRMNNHRKYLESLGDKTWQGPAKRKMKK